MEAKIILGTTNATAIEYLYKDAAGTQTPQTGRTVVRYNRFRVANLGSFRAISFRNTNGAGANAGHLGLTSTGLITLVNTSTTVHTSTFAITPGTWYDLQAALHPGTTTTDGVIEFRISPYADPTSVLATAAVTGTNTGGGFTIKGFRLPTTSVAGAANTVKFRPVEARALASGWIS